MSAFPLSVELSSAGGSSPVALSSYTLGPRQGTMSLEILYIGEPDGTSRHRAEAFRQLGHRVLHLPGGPLPGFFSSQFHRIGYHTGQPFDLRRTNRALLDSIRRQDFDLVWIDKGMTIRPATLRRARAAHPGTAFVAYSPDDMFNPRNQSRRYRACLPLYDLHVTTKSYNVRELSGMGAKRVLFIDNAFDPQAHRPVTLTPEECRVYSVGLGFIGDYEAERARTMLRLAEAGVRVDVWGTRWERARDRHSNLVLRGRRVWDDEYAKAIAGTKISLGFLRKENRDLQTTRSVEIPACGAFMLAERTDEHLRLFVEGREAEFFGTFNELLQKSRYYLEHHDERERIAAAGRKRCIEGGYSNRDRLSRVVEHLTAVGLLRKRT